MLVNSNWALRKPKLTNNYAGLFVGVHRKILGEFPKTLFISSSDELPVPSSKPADPYPLIVTRIWQVCTGHNCYTKQTFSYPRLYHP